MTPLNRARTPKRSTWQGNAKGCIMTTGTFHDQMKNAIHPFTRRFLNDGGCCATHRVRAMPFDIFIIRWQRDKTGLQRREKGVQQLAGGTMTAISASCHEALCVARPTSHRNHSKCMLPYVRCEELLFRDVVSFVPNDHSQNNEQINDECKRTHTT